MGVGAGATKKLVASITALGIAEVTACAKAGSVRAEEMAVLSTTSDLIWK